MTVKRLDETTIMVDEVRFQKSDYSNGYVSFSPNCTDDHNESVDLFLATEDSEFYKPSAMELLLDMPICEN